MKKEISNSDLSNIKFIKSDHSLWLTIDDIAAIFGSEKSIIEYLVDSIKKRQLQPTKQHTTRIIDGVEYIHMDAILEVAAQLNSHQAIQFISWTKNIITKAFLKSFHKVISDIQPSSTNETTEELPEQLSDFNQKLNTALNYNPKLK